MDPHLAAGRNDLCPCGSGRKFKQCCGSPAARAVNGTSSEVRPGALVAGATICDNTGGGPNLGQLTEAAEIRAMAENHREIQSGLQAYLFNKKCDASFGRVPRSPAQLMAAERHRQLGMSLLQSGKFAAAITALRRATTLNPEDVLAHHALGQAYLHSGHFAEAAVSLQLAVILKDDLANAHLDLAAALGALARDREAVAACRQAVKLAPQSARGHHLLGELLETTGEVEEAALSFRLSANCVPETSESRLDLARALLLERNVAEAEACLRGAIVLDPGSDELYRALGDLLAAEGRFDEAVEACDRALSLNPLQVPAHLLTVRVKKCTESDRPRLARMLSTFRRSGVTDAHRLFLHFAIGKMLDDLGDYCGAMRHFDAANKIKSRSTRFDRAALVSAVDRRIEQFTSAFFAANTAFGLNDETPVIIVGMPRSGTTLLEQIVSSHPMISAGEELFFWFNRARSPGVALATSLTPEAGSRLAQEYVALLRRIGPAAARVTDKQTFNFQQLGLIYLVLPKARIIHCRRNPIDTCLSMYSTYFKGRLEFVSDKADLGFAYKQYLKIMQHWREVLPSDRLLEVDYKDLVADREMATRRLIDFCGLDWDDNCLQPERNERLVSTASVWQARQPVFATSLERWRRYEPWIGELRQLLPADR